MLKQRVALVTGSTGGIGLGIAEALAAEGCNVIVNGRRPEGKAVAQSLAERYSVGAEYLSADLGDATQVGGLVDDAERAFGRLDILVNNAGIQVTAPVESFPLESWESVIATNLSGVFYATRAALPHLRRGGWGRIINIASVHGMVGSVHKAAYVAAKHAVLGLTKVVALETAEEAITCNSICPGWVLTPLVQQQIDARADAGGISVEQAQRELLEEKQPSAQFVTTEAIGAMTVFLCSEAAAQMTGASLPIDGGWTAR